MTDEYYAVGSQSGSDVYHVDPDCQGIHHEKHLSPRSEAYVEWHDLGPCTFCGPGADLDGEVVDG